MRPLIARSGFALIEFAKIAAMTTPDIASTESPAVPSEPSSPVPSSPAPQPPLISRVADEASNAAIERAAYFGHGCFVIIIAPNGQYQMRSTTLDTNVLLGVLTRAIAVIAQPTPETAPAALQRG